MFELRHFRLGTRTTAVGLPADIEQRLADWQAVRLRMTREHDPVFSRSEWAYLIQFMDIRHLRAVVEQAFGVPVAAGPADRLAWPRHKVALWLPNNVSLLGPLVLLMLSLTGAEVRIKTGSRSEDLCASFIGWLQRAAPGTALGRWLDQRVSAATFDRTDQRNAEMSAWADVRMMFGGDAASQALERLAHPHDSTAFYFGDRVSEAWIDPAAVNPATAETLARVFAMYGQAGCTSPRRVIVVGGTADDAHRLAELMASVWQQIAPRPTPRHTASETVMGLQWARAQGLQARVLGGHAALAVIGPCGQPVVTSNMAIALQWGTLDQALASQPTNLQTVGQALSDAGAPHWQDALAHSPAVRFVPLGEMHHFGPVWDGMAWWEGLFRIKSLERRQP